MFRMTLFALAFATMLLSVTGDLSIAAETETSLIQFEIKDQFDRIHTSAEYTGNIVMVIASDKDGSEFNRVWSPAINDSLQGEAAYGLMRTLPVAHLKGVPFFLKGMIKGKFPKDEKTWVLMDWKGQFNKAYEFEKKNCNILVFDGHGNLAHKTFGRELDEDKLAEVLSVVRGLMQAKLDQPLRAEP